jgi:hypothetical protein
MQRLNTYEGVEALLISALDGGEGSASHPGHFISAGRNPQYPLDGRLWILELVWTLQGQVWGIGYWDWG